MAQLTTWRCIVCSAPLPYTGPTGRLTRMDRQTCSNRCRCKLSRLRRRLKRRLAIINGDSSSRPTSATDDGSTVDG